MIFWLDFKLFGNGHGLKTPFWDDVFYWIDGRFYHWVGGFGAQLASIEWRVPDPGTERRLLGLNFRVFNVSRKWPRVMVTWAVCNHARGFDDIAALKLRLPGNAHASIAQGGPYTHPWPPVKDSN